MTGRRGKVTYQVWLVFDLHADAAADSAAVAPELAVDPVLSADSSRALGERLQDAVAEVVGDRTGEMIWRSADDLSEGQMAALIADLPDTISTLTEKLLMNAPAAAVGVSAAAASLGADVTTALLLKPVLEPVEGAVHALEVVGIVIGMLSGLHGLVIFCVKHVAHDELGSALSSAFKQLIGGVQAEPVAGRPSAVSSIAAGWTDRSAGSTAASPTSAPSRPTAVNNELSTPQEHRIATISATGRTGDKVSPVVVSSETARRLRAAAELTRPSNARNHQSMTSARDILLSAAAEDDELSDLGSATKAVPDLGVID